VKFTLSVRMVEARELNSSTYFLPEVSEYESYLRALHEDISQLDSVLDVTRHDSSFLITTTRPITVVALKAMLRPVFTETILSNLRFDSLVDS